MDFSLLQKYQIPVVPYKVVSTKKEALKSAAKLGFPIALKLISKKIPHKSEHHALAINLKTQDSVSSEFERLKKIDKRAKILVQKFMPHSLELILGGKTDSQFGPTILLGLGGIYTEILQDTQIRICPVEDRQIRSMISQLQSFEILKGTRGQRGVNLLQLTIILKKLSKLMSEKQPKELDINPMILTNDGLMAADVRVIK